MKFISSNNSLFDYYLLSAECQPAVQASYKDELILQVYVWLRVRLNRWGGGGEVQEAIWITLPPLSFLLLSFLLTVAHPPGTNLFLFPGVRCRKDQRWQL